MNRHHYKDLIIEVLDEPHYQLESADNNFNYLNHYFGDGAIEHSTSKHGVRIFQHDKLITNCIIIGSGGGTGVHPHSSLIDNDQLVICCCDTIFCLTLPALELQWKTKADQSSCFQIFKHQDDYIVHGELQVTKLNKQGQVKWEFSGADIFVSIDHEAAFQMEKDGIVLTDFAKTKYKIDFDGKLLWDTYKR